MLFFNSSLPKLNENNLDDQSGKVFIVTGSTAGVGKQLASILYKHNAKVYIAARSSSKADATMREIKQAHPSSNGTLVFLELILDDLTGIKASAERFLQSESRLDVLWNNAGVMIPPQGSTTKQGYELQLGVNNLGPFLFTKLLTPLLVATAQLASPNSVRVVWVSSQAQKRYAPVGGIDMENLSYKDDVAAWQKYGASKAGNIFHSSEFAKRYAQKNVISLAVDPGLLKTDLYTNMPRWQLMLASVILRDPIWGAYVELYAGLSAKIKQNDSGAFIEPIDKHVSPRADVALATLEKSDGGTGVARQFWEWSEAQVAPYC